MRLVRLRGDRAAAEDGPHFGQVALTPKLAIVVCAPRSVAARAPTAAFVDAVSASPQQKPIETVTADRTLPASHGTSGENALGCFPHDAERIGRQRRIRRRAALRSARCHADDDAESLTTGRGVEDMEPR